MRKYYLFCKLAFAGIFMLFLHSCKKENGIDNETVVKKPYGLFIGDREGQLLNTTDGDYYKTLFSPDGYPSRAITTSGENILWVKNNVHLSVNNGKNFNPTYQSLQFIPFLKEPMPWPQIILNVPSHARVYVASLLGKGIAYSEDNGSIWKTDMEWENGVVGGDISSFAQLGNGVLFAHSWRNDSLYRRKDASAQWSWVEPINGLPAGPFYITSMNNTLVATDVSGVNGLWMSQDEGVNWSRIPGLPTDKILYTTHAPFNQTLLVGTDSAGVYRLENTGFVPSNFGLEDYTVVYAIKAKNNIYKNEANKEYVYLATDKGLYRSDDLGRNWYLVKPGHYVALY